MISTPSLGNRTRGASWLRLLSAVILLAGFVPAQITGSLLPPDQLTQLSNTKAQTFEDFQGRCVLIEFFAYW